MPDPWPFDGLERGAFRCILADPPWHFRVRSAKGEGKSPQSQYQTQDLAWIKALPVADLAHPDGAACIIWATAPMLPQAFEVLAAWGFAFKTSGAWAKQSSTGAKLHFGTGYLYRSAAEFWLLGTRGRPAQTSRAVRNLILAPVREHSRKPDQMHQDLERLFEGPRCELFGRQSRPGWTVWGNEATRFDHPTLETAA